MVLTKYTTMKVDASANYASEQPKSYLFRKTLQIPFVFEEQKQPHDIEHSIDPSVDVWDSNLERLLNEYRIYSSSIKLQPVQAVILPKGRFHCFKKINSNQLHDNDNDNNVIPMVSCACDASYIGIEQFQQNYHSILVSTFDGLM